MGTVWTERRAGERVSATPPDLDGSQEFILDPNLSPDWVRLPEDTPGGLARVECRVVRSVWFPLGLSHHWVETGEGDPWISRPTRWHVVAPTRAWDQDHPLAVAEVPGAGFHVVDLGPSRVQVLLEWDLESPVREEAVASMVVQ